MKTMSIKAYAVANKISIYNVVKQTRDGSLKTEVKNIDGKDEVFILVDEAQPVEKAIPASLEAENIEDCKKAYMRLKIKYDQLQHKYDTLQQTISSKKVL
jgi:hypothetical protein